MQEKDIAGSSEDTSPMDTAESVNIESTPVVEVMQVVNIITESTIRNSKFYALFRLVMFFSHGGHFGKTGIRNYHLKRN